MANGMIMAVCWIIEIEKTYRNASIHIHRKRKVRFGGEAEAYTH